MEWHVLLVAIATLTFGVETSFSDRIIGCLVAPDICIPPENYCSDDGFIGNCQLPDSNLKWRIIEKQLPYLKIIKEFETKGNMIDYKTVQDALLYEKYYQDQYDRFLAEEQLNQDVERLNELVSNLGYKYSNGETITGVLDEKMYSDHQQDRNDQDDKHQEMRRSTLDSNEISKISYSIRERRMRLLVDNARKMLEKHGIKISNLTDENVELLAKLLARKLKDENTKSENEEESVQKDTEEVGLKDTKQVVLAKSISDEKQGMEMEDVNQAPLSDEEKSHVDVPHDEEKVLRKEIPNDNSEFEIAADKQAKKTQKNKTFYLVIIVVGATILLIIFVTLVTCCVRAYKHKEDKKMMNEISTEPEKPLGDDYQELCRQHYASKNSEQTEMIPSKDPNQNSAYPSLKSAAFDNSVVDPTASFRSELLSRASQATTRNSSVSSMSWSEEPVTASLDITTGHAILSYMEDHLRNKNRLDKEWDEICSYEDDDTTTHVATDPSNARKNRSVAALPYDHNRIKLIAENNQLQSDYINASSIIDNDPKRPLYIAAQGPLPSTIPDFWQVMWEQGCVAIVMLTPLVEEGVNQCARYWPDEGSCTYHKFEIHLVSEHIWCEDYLVRSLYLKNLETGDTRTVTQFHFLSWPNGRVPSTPKPLLELRRKVTKCYKGHNSPVLVHCSDGVGRTGTYILLDLAIDRMLKGAKEMDIAATLEHIRDQRSGMVGTKEQFEFALTAVAEEVNAILKTLLH